ncbi:TRAP-type mannitol/chloroaromatic compound transport system, substrate-binding protein [Albimonas donghaensis]|uniref:TRAP-type mannitol/chloroaromatic compound transport system, substrate-binding protein n=1 Tax=Albimonas donghaensis TaxID=356660 RepID=A0A1H2VJA4_9RHOB|nr:TRAP transporter substrate-binding protein DctP [Albimonas donghaensis]SDW68024.1 TRAP-type mannitol/chloroaromatic compound transport system, substrate-binding protein [Albimonas donghaensis]
MTDTFKTSRRALLAGGGAAALAAPALIGPAIAKGEVNWRVQAVWPKASSSFGGSLQVLADMLAEQTDGRFTWELFGAGEFAKGPEIYDIVRKGVVQAGTSSASYMGQIATTSAFAYGIPGTLNDYWQVGHYNKNLGIEALMSSETEEDGVIYKAEKSYPTELVLSKEINSAADFASLKVRSSGALLDYLSAAGASASYIPGSELYQALSSGVVDGAHWGAAVGAKTMSLWEVCKYQMHPPLAFTSDCWVFNADAVEDLPDDLRLILMSLIETRYYARTAEYQLLETLAIEEGKAEQGVEVRQWPDDVQEIFVKASAQILEAEGNKSEKAAKAADTLKEFMGQLGIV